MKKILMIGGLVLFCFFANAGAPSLRKLSIKVYKDKVAGGWAGKMIGVEYGSAFEFQHDNELYEGEISWNPDIVKEALANDDLYVQMCFMMVLDSLGIDCPATALAEKLADERFELCHANRMARRNFWRGIMPPLSGNPKYSMHADDIDFQIESDYIGFINPGMPVHSVKVCNKVGHIMNYGDGVYGGMFVSAMHTQAFFENNVEKVVTQALKAIPTGSLYAQCVREIIDGYHRNPSDWRKTWKEFTAKWGETDICVPNHPFNEDAKFNGAYVVLALLYGGGDLGKTMEIAVRSGQDTDCNAATAAGVLGVIKGYAAIEEKWKSVIHQIADKEFIYTNYTFNKAIDKCLDYARMNVAGQGGRVSDSDLYIRIQQPRRIFPLEQSFPGIKYSYQTTVMQATDWHFSGSWTDFVIGRGDNDVFKHSVSAGNVCELVFEGKAILLEGYCHNNGGMADLYLDGKFIRTIDFYYREEAGIYLGNRAHLFHELHLKPGKHTLRLVTAAQKNPRSAGNNVWVERALIYK
jgi:hypothetical protein